MNKNTKEILRQRLDEIGKAVAGTGNGLALIGLGSAGTEVERLDDYSDLISSSSSNRAKNRPFSRI